MADVVREVIANNITDRDGNERASFNPDRMFSKEADMLNGQSSSSSYTLAEDHSTFSRDIDRWMTGGHPSVPSALDNGTQNHRPVLVQRSVLARSSSLDSQGMWYLLAMILPLFSMSCPHWRCTPSLMLNTAEIFMTQFGRMFTNVRLQIRQLSQDQFAREVFATLMDIVLVIYAIGFLVLSLYQASMFG